jgi:hypothetical protein
MQVASTFIGVYFLLFNFDFLLSFFTSAFHDTCSSHDTAGSFCMNAAYIACQDSTGYRIPSSKPGPADYGSSNGHQGNG